MRHSLVVFLLAVGCSSSHGTNSLPNLPPGSTGPDGGSSPGDDSGSGTGIDSGGSPPVSDGGPTVGTACDPNQSVCPSDLLCCPVGGQPHEGGVFYSCKHPTGTPPACP